MTTHNSQSQIIHGILSAAAISLAVTIGYRLSPTGSGMETFFFALGGKWPDGIIQFGTFACFFTCYFAIKGFQQRMVLEEQAWKYQLLPETGNYVLYPEDVHEIKQRTMQIEADGNGSLLTDLIKQATSKFRAEHSISETMTMVESVSTLQQRNMEKEFWLVSICQSLIPALGFLGTVWGMAAAILSMGDSQSLTVATGTAAQPTAMNMKSIVDAMGTAFFTTIVSIVLGIVVTVLVKQLETRTENLHTTLKRYVMENLVNRLRTA
jgi:biopolymer transport protein ExbB/TolQ